MASEGTEYFVLALERPGAEALLAAAEIGLEGADPALATVDLEAGLEALAALRRVLTGDVDDEEAIVRDAVAVLRKLNDEGAVYPLPAEERAALARLAELLRGQEVSDEAG